MDTRQTPRPPARALAAVLGGFAVSAGFTLTSDLSLAGFCWSFWLVGLYSAYFAALRFALSLFVHRATLLKERFVPNATVAPATLMLVAIAVTGIVGAALLYAASWVYGFYGLFLSVWVRMPPEELFGPNGFINSDFWTPVAYLTRAYWPLVAGQLVSEAAWLLSTGSLWSVQGGAPERRIVALHVMIMALPFAAMLSWMLLGGRYETLTLLILLALKSAFDLRPARATAATA